MRSIIPYPYSRVKGRMETVYFCDELNVSEATEKSRNNQPVEVR